MRHCGLFIYIVDLTLIHPDLGAPFAAEYQKALQAAGEKVMLARLSHVVLPLNSMQPRSLSTRSASTFTTLLKTKRNAMAGRSHCHWHSWTSRDTPLLARQRSRRSHSSGQYADIAHSRISTNSMRRSDFLPAVVEFELQTPQPEYFPYVLVERDESRLEVLKHMVYDIEISFNQSFLG